MNDTSNIDELINDTTFYESYDYSYTSPEMIDPGAVAAFTGVFLGIMLFTIVFSIAAYVVSSIFLGKIFKKAGVEPWKAWVPVYNTWKTLEIGGQQGFWVLLMFVPIVNIVALVFYIIAVHNINLKLNYGVGMTVLAIFLPLIWLIVTGLSKNPWNDSLGAPSLGARSVATSYPTQDTAQQSAPTFQQPQAPLQPFQQPQASAQTFEQPPVPPQDNQQQQPPTNPQV